MQHSTTIDWYSTSEIQGYRGICSCGWRGQVENEEDREWAQDACTEHERDASDGHHQHPAFEADNCPICGTSVDILGNRCICADMGATGPNQRHTRCTAHDGRI